MPDGSQVYSTIPIILRGGVFVNNDNSRAVGGLFVDRYRVLALGQKLAAGTAIANQLVRVPSVATAAVLFGVNSMLHIKMQRMFDQAPSLEFWAIPQADLVGGAFAIGSITVATAPTASGTFYLYVGAERVAVGVTAGQTVAQVATAIQAAVASLVRQYVTAAVDGVVPSKVNFTAKHKGEAYNYIDLRDSFYRNEALPAGLTLTYAAMSGGTGNPDLAAAIAAFGPTRWAKIAMPYTDGANLTLLENELLRRYGATIQLEGVAHSWATNTLSNLLTLGASRNSPFVSIGGIKGVPAPPFALAARYTALAASAAIIDPPRQLRSLVMANELAPLEGDRFNGDERENLLRDGIATWTVGDDGLMRNERAVTTYQTNGAGVLDPSYRDVETMECLHAIRSDLRGYVATNYPRHKLANDGPGITDAQFIMTPKMAKAAVGARGFLWAKNGLIEDYAQFLTDLAVSRDLNDVDRLNALIRPNVINNFRTFAVENQFIL
jgi:phage tail sheath gpL-like